MISTTTKYTCNRNTKSQVKTTGQKPVKFLSINKAAIYVFKYFLGLDNFSQVVKCAKTKKKDFQDILILSLNILLEAK